MSALEPKHNKGPLAWMAGNSVAANLLMIVLMVGGLVFGLQIKQEVFPEFTSDIVTVTVAYSGASPEEVENGIILPIEEAVQSLEGIDEITSTASEGSGTVRIEALDGADIVKLWQEAKSEVDRITTFPEEAEDPQVSIAARKREVIRLALYGDADPVSLRESAESLRDELLQHDGITQVELAGVRDYEVGVEISEDTLRRYGITLADVATALKRGSVELGGGSLQTSGGDVMVRIQDRREYARQYAKLPIITNADGSRILLEDIATVREGFSEEDSWASFNGKPAIRIEVYRVGSQTPLEVADATFEAMKEAKLRLPEGIELSVIRDMSNIFRQRAELLLKNSYMGLALVFVFLAVFLEIRLAFWVSLGIPISFLGSFLILGTTDFSINMITMFAFIVTLGIVVDDAVVVGEIIYYKRREGMGAFEAAVMGAKEVAMPVCFSVLTNMVAFMPLLFVPGFMGKVFGTIPIVVIAVFAVSLIESLFILPAHLSHVREPGGLLRHLVGWQQKFSQAFERFVRNIYGAFLVKCLEHRYTVLALGLAMMIATAGYVLSGRMGMVLFPKVESDYAYCEVVMPYGSPDDRKSAVEALLVDAARRVIEANGGETLSTGIFSRVKSNNIYIQAYLTDAGIRPLNTETVTNLWRDEVGPISGLETITFESDRGGPGSGKGLTVQLSHRNTDVLDAAGADLAQSLAQFSSVSDIDDGAAKGKRQINLKLTPAGERMGLTSREVANQIRYAFNGVDAVKQQRGRNELSVNLRLPRDERTTEATLEDMVIQAPKGEILLREAATMDFGRAYTSIRRTDGRRVTSVTANVRPQSAAQNLTNELKKQILPDLVKKYPGLTYGFKGKQADMSESLDSIISGLLMALICIYALLAIPFRSYFQPMIIMFCIPFGMIGAVMGHIIMGYSLSILSLFGVVALSGVVVNDSLVLIDFANRRRREGMSIKDAVKSSGIQRFRPIILTTLTTFGGLAPMIVETSRQAKFMIPMAISLGFGVVFATLITLVLVPALYIILDDIQALFSRKKAVEAEVKPAAPSGEMAPQA